jgi:hypothetical protein
LESSYFEWKPAVSFNIHTSQSAPLPGASMPHVNCEVKHQNNTHNAKSSNPRPHIVPESQLKKALRKNEFSGTAGPLIYLAQLPLSSIDGAS